MIGYKDRYQIFFNPIREKYLRNKGRIPLEYYQDLLWEICIISLKLLIEKSFLHKSSPHTHKRNLLRRKLSDSDNLKGSNGNMLKAYITLESLSIGKPSPVGGVNFMVLLRTMLNVPMWRKMRQSFIRQSFVVPHSGQSYNLFFKGIQSNLCVERE